MEDIINNESILDKFFNRFTEKKMIQKNRYDRFEKWLEENDFDKLLYRIILEHDDEYYSRCYENGYEPYPNNIMGFIFKYVTERGGKEVNKKEFDVPFENKIWEFKGYYFQNIWGQGMMMKIYNKEDSREIFSI